MLEKFPSLQSIGRQRTNRIVEIHPAIHLFRTLKIRQILDLMTFLIFLLLTVQTQSHPGAEDLAMIQIRHRPLTHGRERPSKGHVGCRPGRRLSSLRKSLYLLLLDTLSSRSACPNPSRFMSSCFSLSVQSFLCLRNPKTAADVCLIVTIHSQST